MIVNIDKFYKRQQTDVLMFGYVNAILFNLPTTTVEKALLNFQKHHNITEDDMSIDALKRTYYRMQQEYIESQKTKPNG